MTLAPTSVRAERSLHREGATMEEFQNGMLVLHASLGVGKVVAVEPTALHVFFPESEKRYAAKLRWPAAKPLLRTEGVEPNAWLEGLSSFSMDAATGRYALAENWLTHEQATAEFLAAYPGGFEDPTYLGTGEGKRERAFHWRAATAEWGKLLGDGQGERLLASSDLPELLRRIARVERHVALVPGAVEKNTFRDALDGADATPDYLEALFSVLSVPSPGRARFEKLFTAAAAVSPDPALAWPLATLLPFVAVPARHVVLWPKTTRVAAERLGCDIRFDPAPTWAAYAALRSLSAQLLGKLAGIGARDHADVEAFLHVVASTRRGPAAGRRKR